MSDFSPQPDSQDLPDAEDETEKRSIHFVRQLRASSPLSLTLPRSWHKAYDVDAAAVNSDSVQAQLKLCYQLSVNRQLPLVTNNR
jgi:hypothetical protein